MQALSNPTPDLRFDWLFVGMGGATCSLLILMHERGLLDNIRWAVIEPGTKLANDKTYCFWSENLSGGLSAFETFIENEWSQVIIDGQSATSIAPAKYRRIRSLALYSRCREIIQEAGGMHFQAQLVTASAPSATHEGIFDLELDTGARLSAQRVFDSRPPRFNPSSPTDVLLLQSFVGYRIELSDPRNWDIDAFHMMDFQVPQGAQGDTQFMYTLPESPNSGLVELTRFGTVPLTTTEASGILDAYIRDHFGPYTVQEVETGGIPMCMAPMEHESRPVHPRWTALGTRAGRVKPSTGYAFKSMVKHAQSLCDVLEATQNTTEPLPKPQAHLRFAFYDRLLLLILRNRPHRGKPIFQQLFRARPAAFILRFLDESTTPLEETSMFARLPINDFLRACWWRLRDRAFSWIPAFSWLVAVAWMSWAVGTEDTWAIQAGNTALLLGLAVIGIPHGALDAVTGITWGGQNAVPFYFRYLATMAATLLLWWWMPGLAVTAFIGASVWHFGQADATAWHVEPIWVWAVIWGSLVMGFVLGFHLDEVAQILAPLGVSPALLDGLLDQSASIQSALWIGSFILGAAAAWHRKGALLLALAALTITPALPLLWAFGSYFIFHHSLHGWHHLRVRSGWGHRSLWLRGAPFSAGAFLFLIGGAYWASFGGGANDASWGVLFALLSAISLPHILESHRFLARKPREPESLFTTP